MCVCCAVTEMVGESLSGPTLEAVGEGLTEEELEIAKMILQVHALLMILQVYTLLVSAFGGIDKVSLHQVKITRVI